MKIFANKQIFKKILIVIVTIMLFGTIFPQNVVYADNIASDVGGALLSPIASLMIGFGDVLINILHKTIYDMDTSYVLVTKNDDGWGIFWTIITAIVAIVLVAVVAYFTAGVGVALLAKLGVTATIGASTIGAIVTISLAAGAVAGTLTALAWFGDNVIFPLYQISPEEIFKGEISLLNINFFKSQEELNDKYKDEVSGRKIIATEEFKEVDSWILEGFWDEWPRLSRRTIFGKGKRT